MFNSGFYLLSFTIIFFIPFLQAFPDFDVSGIPVFWGQGCRGWSTNPLLSLADLPSLSDLLRRMSALDCWLALWAIPHLHFISSFVTTTCSFWQFQHCCYSYSVSFSIILVESRTRYDSRGILKLRKIMKRLLYFYNLFINTAHFFIMELNSNVTMT